MYCINYTIKSGDTLYRISRHYNVSIETIMEANTLIDLYNLKQDMTLRIPVNVPQEFYTDQWGYVVEDDCSLGDLLDEHSINLADLMEFNNIDEIYLKPGTKLIIPVK